MTAAPPPSGWSTGHGRVAPLRLIAVFVGVLVVALVAAAAISLAVKTPSKAPTCPDPTQACGAPPIAVSFPPVARSSPSVAPDPQPTIVRPVGTVPPVATVEPTAAPTSPPSSSTLPSPSAPPVPSPSLSTVPENPSGAPIAALPSPIPPSSAAPDRAGKVWTSTTYGFSLEYDDALWTVEKEDAGSVILSAGNGALVVFVEGFDARKVSTKQLVQSGVNGLQDLVLGLTQESDAARQLPGRPIVGYRPGVGTLLNGTLNSPQGPTADVALVVIASTDDTISIRTTVLVDQRVRDRGFQVADAVLNAITWPGSRP